MRDGLEGRNTTGGRQNERRRWWGSTAGKVGNEAGVEGLRTPMEGARNVLEGDDEGGTELMVGRRGEKEKTDLATAARNQGNPRRSGVGNPGLETRSRSGASREGMRLCWKGVRMRDTGGRTRTRARERSERGRERCIPRELRMQRKRWTPSKLRGNGKDGVEGGGRREEGEGRWEERRRSNGG